MRKLVTGTTADGSSTIVTDEHVESPATLWTIHSIAANVPASDLEMANEGLGSWQLVTLPPEAVLREFLAAGIPGLDADGFHQTPTTDLNYIVQGPIVLVLDTGETTVETGDVVIQRGTRHAWWNRTEADVVMLSLLLATGDDQQ